ncbi:MraY family glycosyltransferase [Nitrincola alkalilacustris]|uniref:MraY family glycosyltransferase n=1 Tax=Nitrincola alkalilacustris TaxID=1571224 RepID=UPI00124F0F94|nr:glycosyltransferase family 4 protein [Nitrincola alkalilacustris]
MSAIFWLLPIVVSAFVLTGFMLRYALSRNILDVPNDRSSHSQPTPRGGGLAFVATFLTVVAVYAAFTLDTLGWGVVLALILGGGLIALIGFQDDRIYIPVRYRLLVHFIAAIWGIYCLGGLPDMPVFGVEIKFGWAGWLFAAFYMVWLLNLYNFMDGLDGLASLEAVTVCIGGALAYWVAMVTSGQAVSLTDSAILLPLFLAASVFGFLLWNFPPAKIFMGDVGSGFLGFTIGMLSLHAAWIEPQLFWSWVILLAVFVVDATYTLLCRLVRGEQIYRAHRTHAFQYASRMLGSHRSVTVNVALINVIWLIPMSLLVAIGRLDGALGVLIAYLPLLLLAVKLKAGQPEPIVIPDLARVRR